MNALTHNARLRKPNPSPPNVSSPTASDLAHTDRFSHRRRSRSKPLGLIGTDDGLRADALFLLEKYAALDPEIVRALGADTFPPAVFVVGSR